MKSFLKQPPELRNGFKDPKRLAAIHDLPCALCHLKGWKQTSRTTAHHKIGLGLGKKASDRLSMALCESCHQKGTHAIHHIGRVAFERDFATQDELIALTDEMLKKV